MRSLSYVLFQATKFVGSCVFYFLSKWGYMASLEKKILGLILYEFEKRGLYQFFIIKNESYIHYWRRDGNKYAIYEVSK